MKPISLAAYARHRQAAGLPGGTRHAVDLAIQAGRLRRSVATSASGKAKISDVALADAEWAATTHADRRPLTGPAGSSASPARGDDVPDLGEARARRETALADMAEIELAKIRGALIPAADVEARLVAVFSRCKTKLLGVPSRARQQDPDLSAAQLALLESLIREALEDLAGAAEDAEAEQ